MQSLSDIRISLENTTYIDFRGEAWIKNHLKNYSYFYLNGSAFSDCSIQVEENKNRPLGLSKG